MKRKLALVALCIAAPLTMASTCDSNTPPAPDSDSSSNYKEGSKIPVDDAVYTIRGTVADSISSLTHQVSPGGGSLNGATCYGTSGCYGGGGGTLFGPVESGKGFVRLQVQSSLPPTDLAPEGDIAILKVSDTKGSALLPGDLVTFKCRRQYEAVAAVRDDSNFDSNKVATYELDFCRLASPVITVKTKP